jgi:hypothetical protein
MIHKILSNGPQVETPFLQISVFIELYLTTQFFFYSQRLRFFKILKYLMHDNTLPAVSNCLHNAGPEATVGSGAGKDIEKLEWGDLFNARSSHMGFVVDKVTWSRFPP